MMKTAMLFLAMLCLPLASHAATPGQPLTPVNNGSPLQFTGNLTYYGSSSYFVEASTPAGTPILLASGPGYFYGAECSSGTAGDFAMAFDSASTSGITINTKAKALTPAVLTQVNVPASTSIVTTFEIDGSTTTTITLAPATTDGKYVPPGGSKRVVNGLVAIKNGSDNANCQFQFLSDAVIRTNVH